MDWGEREEGKTQGLKPNHHRLVTARVNPCPVTKRKGLTFGERELHPSLRQINFGFGFDYEHD
jgi:hypothetical protein